MNNPLLSGRRGMALRLLCPLTLVCALHLHAQTAEPATRRPDAVATVELPASAAASSATAASSAASSATAPEPAASAPNTCRRVSDQAMAADLRAATAQSQRTSPQEMAPLFDEAMVLWQQAVDQCEGRARDRALRNVQDTSKALAGNSELLGAGPECAAARKDAETLQELAAKAREERRWSDSALIFHKAENQWDAASERCTGTQQQLALKHRDEVEIDAYNAEFCGPAFDRARALLLRLRSTVAPAPEEKTRLSMAAETGWRDAMLQCRGPALDLARQTAQGLARERGTPWVETREAAAPEPSVASLVPVAKPVPGAAAGATTARTASKPVVASTPASATLPAPAAVAAPVAAALPVAAQAAELKPRVMPDEFISENTRFVGRFVGDYRSSTYSGTGKVFWPNGDSFDGTLVKGVREGKGLFIWANGQRYEGEWHEDAPNGQGTMRFASGDTFTGPFVQGSPSGRGVYLWTSGQRFECDWVDNKCQGKGTLRFANGDLYEGDILDGRAHGTGRLVFASGDIYTGELKFGQPDGQGRFEWTNHDQYSGLWKAGVKEGAGVMLWSNGDRWEGTYHQDEPADEGKMVRKHG